MGLSWQQGPLGRDPNGTFLTATPMPERVLYVEPLRRRMRVALGGSTIVQSDGAVLLFEPARYPVAYFPLADIADGVLEPTDHESTHPRNGLRRRRSVLPCTPDQVVADTRGPLVLYESGFAPRWYVPRVDVNAEALHPVEGQTFCPYKGLASYYDIGAARNAAWSYRAPFEAVAPIADLVSFEPDKVTITIDGEMLEPVPGQTVLPHGPDRNLSVDEIGGIQLVEDATPAEARS